jgi:hypothetical protein
MAPREADLQALVGRRREGGSGDILRRRQIAGLEEHDVGTGLDGVAQDRSRLQRPRDMAV